MTQMAAHIRWMRLALSLGEQGLGQTWPNPSVGCVIVKDGLVLGRAHTHPSGRPHAETIALDQAGSKAQGATAYVTLEPCAHHGKTGPCAQALIKAGISTVVAALEDPNPLVNSAGFEQLRNAGVEVITDILRSEALKTHAGFLSVQTRKRPFVTLKLATSIDGKIATHSGHSQWITGPDARKLGHLERARHDAVLVGVGTVLADDPDLCPRIQGLNRNTVRIIADSKGRTPSSAKMFENSHSNPVWICHGKGANIPSQATSVLCETDRRLNLVDMMEKLATKGLTRIYCEGGAKLAAGLIKANLVDRLVLMMAPKIIGGDGLPALSDIGVETLTDAPEFILESVDHIGPDTVQTWLREI